MTWTNILNGKLKQNLMIKLKKLGKDLNINYMYIYVIIIFIIIKVINHNDYINITILKYKIKKNT